MSLLDSTESDAIFGGRTARVSSPIIGQMNMPSKCILERRFYLPSSYSARIAPAGSSIRSVQRENHYRIISWASCVI